MLRPKVAGGNPWWLLAGSFSNRSVIPRIDMGWRTPFAKGVPSTPFRSSRPSSAGRQRASAGYGPVARLICPRKDAGHQMAVLFILVFCAWRPVILATVEPRHLTEVHPLPRALDPAFEFRKFKIFDLTPQARRSSFKNGDDDQGDSTRRRNLKSKAVTQEASINFERAYRLFGAVTAYDQRQRQGEYFDFYWRAKRRSNITVRFEYKQENLRAFTQAQELNYHDVRGTLHSAFRVTGDEYLDDGKVLAWRCLLVENGRIVAEKRSFLWERS